MKKLLGITALLVITGCAVADKYESDVFKSTSTLQIDKEFSNLGNASRVYFQNSQRVAKSQLDSWQSHCNLYVFKRGEKASYTTSVVPGSFEITRAATAIESVDLGNAAVQYASFGWGRYDPPSFVLYKTTLYLKSAAQPNVQSLNCVQKVSIYGDHHLSEEQIANTLPDYFSFVKE